MIEKLEWQYFKEISKNVIFHKINELVDAVNELKEKSNTDFKDEGTYHGFRLMSHQDFEIINKIYQEAKEGKLYRRAENHKFCTCKEGFEQVKI